MDQAARESKLIDFLYVDENRVYDLITQISRGLKTSQQSTETTLNSDASNKSTITSVDGKGEGGVDIPFFAKGKVTGKASAAHTSGTDIKEELTYGFSENLDVTRSHKVDILTHLFASNKIQELKPGDTPSPRDIVLFDMTLNLYDGKTIVDSMIPVIKLLMGQSFAESVPEKVGIEDVKTAGKKPDKVQREINRKIAEAVAEIKNTQGKIEQIIETLSSVFPRVLMVHGVDSKIGIQTQGSVPRKNFVEDLDIVLTKFGKNLGDNWKVLSIIDKEPYSADRIFRLVSDFANLMTSIGNMPSGEPKLENAIHFQDIFARLGNLVSDIWGIIPSFISGTTEKTYTVTPIIIYREL